MQAISIIICSINPAGLSALRDNIHQTVGLPYELIAIDNRGQNKGISQVYNEAAAMSRYPFLCFIHEDVKFDTKGWGQLVINHLSNHQIGIVGIAGGDAKSLVPGSWSIPLVSNEINVYQHFKHNPQPAMHFRTTGSLQFEKKRRVVALDGVFLCTRKEVWNEFKFDQQTFPGFHGYDIDYSLQVGQKYALYVIFDITLHHFSEGNPDREWVKTAIIISRKWKKILPITIAGGNPRQFRLHHWHSLQVFLQKLIQLNYSWLTITRHFLAWSFTRYFTVRNFLSMAKYLLLASFNRNKNYV
ncbi:glycosyltransferase [Flavihumibacter sp. ZG627]|uniref:glycosyltransferase n=1 Tax=Flavihumibacter sp. ZG627 TaxID=1463156 RepID=UPI000693F77C|nr:glycosyltransferase [Flavihumibacter sp. ZG627]